MIDRRQFLLSLAVGAFAGLPETGRGADSPATCKVHPREILGRVPDDFTGLSFEANALADAGLLHPSNASLIGHIRTLGPKGVLRIGGNSSEFTEWNPSRASASSSDGIPGPGADLSDIPLPYNPNKKHRRTGTTPEAIDNLAAFLDAVDWKLIYGLNLGMGTPEQAAAEAAYVVKAIGDRLLFLQIGNEPDLFHQNGLRQSDYAFDDFYTEWSHFADAVMASTPKAPLAGPDVASAISWMARLVDRASNRIGMLTGHYYAEGPPSDPSMTIERLLRPNAWLADSNAKIVALCRSSKLPYRMTECNSCYSGGKTGVSDTFASALWAVDYMLQLATAGYLGVNFHGGRGGIYTPMAGDPDQPFSARPLYYGLLMAGQFAGADLVRAELDSAGVNSTAYAANRDKELLVAVVNKDMTQAISVEIDPGRHVHQARLWRLAAPAVDATSGVTLAGARVSDDGAWSPSQEETLDVHHGRCTVDLPTSSAGLLFLR